MKQRWPCSKAWSQKNFPREPRCIWCSRRRPFHIIFLQAGVDYLVTKINHRMRGQQLAVPSQFCVRPFFYSSSAGLDTLPQVSHRVGHLEVKS